MSIDQVLSGATRWYIEQGDSAVVLTGIPDASIDDMGALRRRAHVEVHSVPLDNHVT